MDRSEVTHLTAYPEGRAKALPWQRAEQSGYKARMDRDAKYWSEKRLHKGNSIRLCKEKLVINHLTGEYLVMDPKLKPYYDKAIEMLQPLSLEHIKPGSNSNTNSLAQLASASSKSVYWADFHYRWTSCSSSFCSINCFEADVESDQRELLEYISNPSKPTPQRI